MLVHRLVIPFLLGALFGCSDISGPGGNIAGRFYFNSFESPQDTVGWRGYGMMQILDEPSPGGDRHSVRISGGCFVPHASIDIAGPSEDSRLLLRCWGRNLANGGGLGLMRTRDLNQGVHVFVSDTTWAAYQSRDTLFVPAGDSLHIEMSAGGIIYSAMLVDQLEVVEVR